MHELTQRLIEGHVAAIINHIGDDHNRPGLSETPSRVAKAYDHIFSGYSVDEKAVFKEFDSEGYDGIVLLKNMEFYSMCEHHMLPFFGKMHIAYIPDKKVIGISKLARLSEVFSRRLQIQERLGNQIVKSLNENLKPIAAACIIEGQHLCMLMRGVEKQNSVMTTSSVCGSFKEDPKARAELMQLIK